MKETTQVRISRLEARKGEINKQIKTLQDSNTRNKDFKINKLTDERLVIESRLKELREKIHS